MLHTELFCGLEKSNPGYAIRQAVFVHEQGFHPDLEFDEKDMTAYAAEARKVTKRYGSFTALDKVDITVKRGAVYGLVGDNGAGDRVIIRPS